MTSLPAVLRDATVAHGSDPRYGDRFDQVVRLAQAIFGVSTVAVNLVDDVKQSTVAMVGLDGADMARDVAFCPHVVDSDQAMVVVDASVDDRFSDNPLVTGDPHIRFYAGEPLHGPSGQALGALCIIDDRPRQITVDEQRMLRDLADWVEKELQIDADSAQAREVQRRLLPRRPLEVAGYEIAGQCRPARNVGGDYFDWMTLPDGTAQIAVADVMGKGMEAAVVAAGVRSVVRGASRFGPLTESIGLVGQAMEEDFSDTGTFCTLFAARLTPSTGQLDYVDAGHGLAIIIPTHGDVRRLTSRDLPLGAVSGDSWTLHHEQLAPGDTLLVVSDGILDLFPDAGAALQAGVALSADVRDARAMADAITGVGGDTVHDDDITAVVVRREPAAHPRPAP
ncbi:PP2C family protein-serine/threonine phosphatase [Nocardioides bigeumensis]|uniref:GAF domain-containing protein n=1 Tax=Nocardioides bigeumensis TaxID=433657 RepID=A0ABP5JN36_9ACTN